MRRVQKFTKTKLAPIRQKINASFVNRKSYAIYRTVSFLMILSDSKLEFQGPCTFQRRNTHTFIKKSGSTTVVDLQKQERKLHIMRNL